VYGDHLVSGTGGHLGSGTGGCGADDDPVHHRLGGGRCVPGRVCVRVTDSSHHRSVCAVLHPIHSLQGKEVYPGFALKMLLFCLDWLNMYMYHIVCDRHQQFKKSTRFKTIVE
jgi:hypothetical protein